MMHALRIIWETATSLYMDFNWIYYRFLNGTCIGDQSFTTQSWHWLLDSIRGSLSNVGASSLKVYLVRSF